MTDTPLDLDYIEHRMASPMVTYRESVEEDMPALVAALRKAEAQVADVLALCDEAPKSRPFMDDTTSARWQALDQVRALLDRHAPEEGRCRAHRDGECHWTACPQIRDGEPKASGRHCPIDTAPEEGR